MTDYAAQIADDGDPLRSILRAVRDWNGPPPTVALGRPVVTTHSYDAASRMVRSETVWWTTEDMEMVAALAAFEAGLCPGCGDPIAETTDPKNEERYDVLDWVLCHKCVARELAARKHANHPHPEALLHTVGLKKPTTA